MFISYMKKHNTVCVYTLPCNVKELPVFQVQVNRFQYQYMNKLKKYTYVFTCIREYFLR